MQVSQLDVTTVVVRSQGLVHCELGEDVTIMSVESGKYYGTTSVGACIWRCIEHPATIDAICDRLEQLYKVDRPRCECDVLQFVRHLIDEGLVSVVSRSTEG